MNLMHLANLLLHRWSSLKWRRHGIGALQAYLAEDGDRETRVHVWHPLLVRPGIRDHGDMHDHRFSFVSTVLVGEIVNRMISVTENPEGLYQVHQILHARANPMGAFSLEPMRVVPGPLEACARYVDVAAKDIPVHARESYMLPIGRFHATIVDCLAVTVVTKFDQVDAGARVLARRDAPPVAAFDPNDADDATLQARINEVLEQARAALAIVR
jgi:hypothetical protein